ncbi:MAG: SGNH/GDSL hydrolase family protein [Ilumatobacteraceae bacterium]
MRARRVRMAFGAALAASLICLGGDPAASTQPDVVIVGDSLTAGNLNLIRARLEAGGLSSVRYAALSGRRIADPVYLGFRRESGVEAVRDLRAQGVDPVLWVVELGTNDLGYLPRCGCPDPTEFAGELIDELVAEIGPGEPIAWVNVLNISNLELSEQFNVALRRRAAVDPLFSVIDWYGTGWTRPELFLDHVHHNLAGVDVFADLYLAGIGAVLDGLDRAAPSMPPASRLDHDGFSRADVAR